MHQPDLLNKLTSARGACGEPQARQKAEQAARELERQKLAAALAAGKTIPSLAALEEDEEEEEKPDLEMQVGSVERESR